MTLCPNSSFCVGSVEVLGRRGREGKEGDKRGREKERERERETHHLVKCVRAGSVCGIGSSEREFANEIRTVYALAFSSSRLEVDLIKNPTHSDGRGDDSCRS